MRIVGTVAAVLGVLGVVVGPPLVSGLPPYWLSGALVLLAVAGLLAVAASLLWPDTAVAVRVSVCAFSAVAGGAVTWIAFLFAGFAVATHDVCTADGTDDGLSVGVAAALVVYAAIGAAGFQRPRWLPFAWMLAGIVGAAVFFGLTLAFPPGHSFCET
jgi:hypothetical protein